MTQNAARLNRLQIREQQQINKARKLQDEVEEARRQQRMQNTKAKFDYVPSTAAQGFGTTPRGGSGGVVGGVSSFAGDDAKIRVFIRECDGDAAQHFVYRESEALSGADIMAPHRELPPPRGAPRVGARGVGGGAGSPYSGGASSTASGGSGGASSPIPSYSLAPVCAPGERDGGKLGRVPRYLLQRKAEMAEAKRASAEEAERREQLAKVPPGHRLVSEEEKATTLKELEQRHYDLEMQLRKIPVRFDTQGLKQKRKAIEDEMEQIEQTMNKYNTKRTLYIPVR